MGTIYGLIYNHAHTMKNVIILAVIAVGIVGFAYFALFSTPAHELASEAESTMEELGVASGETEVTAQPRQGTGSLDYLRLLNENLECTVSYTDATEGSKVEGTYFVSDGSMRGDFLTAGPDLSGTILSSMIIDSGMMYVWSEIEGEAYGVKMDLASVNDSDVSANEPIALDAAVEYDCKPWREVDRTVFVPPSTVLFQDMNEIMRGGMEYGTVYEGMEMPY